MKTLKKAYYGFMYELTDAIMWFGISGYKQNPEAFVRFWNISNEYRLKRDAV